MAFMRRGNCGPKEKDDRMAKDIRAICRPFIWIDRARPAIRSWCRGSSIRI